MTRNLPSTLDTTGTQVKPKHRDGPAGLHLIPRRIEEMRRRGAPEEAIQEILEAFKDKLPQNILKTLSASPAADLAATIGESAEAANSATLDLLGGVGSDEILIAGEMPPHLIYSLLDHGVGAIQVCDPSPHGHRPPHFRDMEMVPDFKGVTALTEIHDDSVDIILIHAFMLNGELALVCPLALMATRLWPEAKIVAVTSDHRAPHHVVELRRPIDQYLFWE